MSRQPRPFERLPSSTAASESPITISSDEDEPPKKKTKLEDKAKVHLVNTMANSRPPGPPHHLPDAKLSAPQNANIPISASSEAFHAALVTAEVVTVIDDIISTGLEYFRQLRENDELQTDPNFRKLLLDPLPGVEKPLMIVAADKVPGQLYEYFYTLTCTTNKIFAALYIWLDLYINHKIYVAFKVLCSIQERLFFDCKKVFGFDDSLALEDQRAASRLYMTGMWSSIQLLEAWAKSEKGNQHLREIKMAAEGVEEDDVRFVDDMLARVNYNEWKGHLNLQKGLWMYYPNQRYQ